MIGDDINEMIIKKIQKKMKTIREVYTAYICAECDTDFGINEIGCMADSGIRAVICPVCGGSVHHVYYVVKEEERKTPHQKNDDGEEEEESWRQWRKQHPREWLS